MRKDVQSKPAGSLLLLKAVRRCAEVQESSQEVQGVRRGNRNAQVPDLCGTQGERQCEGGKVSGMQNPVRLAVDRAWSEYPIGTKAHAFNGGYWIRVANGWKWCSGSVFPTPGADACGQCIELPQGEENDCSPHSVSQESQFKSMIAKAVL